VFPAVSHNRRFARGTPCAFPTRRQSTYNDRHSSLVWQEPAAADDYEIRDQGLSSTVEISGWETRGESGCQGMDISGPAFSSGPWANPSSILTLDFHHFLGVTSWRPFFLHPVVSSPRRCLYVDSPFAAGLSGGRLRIARHNSRANEQNRNSRYAADGNVVAKISAPRATAAVR
jgi:hypothetical protein